MGTNYYWHSGPTCDHCGRRDENPLHIGKLSNGWAFALRIHPDLNIESLEDWLGKWKMGGGIIYDEYGAQVKPSEMLSIILDREEPRDLKHHLRHHTIHGCAFELDVREAGLTYDLCNYEFS